MKRGVPRGMQPLRLRRAELLARGASSVVGGIHGGHRLGHVRPVERRWGARAWRLKALPSLAPSAWEPPASTLHPPQQLPAACPTPPPSHHPLKPCASPYRPPAPTLTSAPPTPPAPSW
jgi:hypothetical protein